MSASSSTPGAGGASSHGDHCQQSQQLHSPLDPRETKSLNDRLKAFFKGFGKGATSGAVGGLGIQGPGKTVFCFHLHPFEKLTNIVCLLF